MGGRSILFSGVLPILVLTAILTGCSGERHYARLPDGVSVAVAWNESDERWHIGVIGEGDRPDSRLRVLCITEAGNTPDRFDDLVPGINIDVSLAEDEGHGSLHGVWSLDGQAWDDEDWVRNQGTFPPNFQAPSPSANQSLYEAVRDAETATFTSLASIDGAPLIAASFDTASLFSTPLQPTLDDCDPVELNKQLSSEGVGHYAYWHPELERHWITMTLPELSGQALVYVACAPTAFYDETPSWLSPKGDDSVALIANIHLEEEDRFTGEASVQWSSNTVGREFAQWEVRDGSLSPDSHRSNLKLYDALRRSAVLDFVVRQDGADDLRLQIGGATALSAPLASILHGCVQEYADAYEQ